VNRGILQHETCRPSVTRENQQRRHASRRNTTKRPFAKFSGEL